MRIIFDKKSAQAKKQDLDSFITSVMTNYKNLIISSFSALSAIWLTSCDGGSNSNDDVVEELSGIIERGLSADAIISNPAGRPGFPYFLENGETITFIPADSKDGGFLEDVPLGIWQAQSSGFLRQENTTPTIDFPVDEATFRYFYVVAQGNPGEISTLGSAGIQYSFEHVYDREADFVPRLQTIQTSSSGPGSLDDALRGGGVTSSLNAIVADSIGVAGIAAAVGIQPGAFDEPFTPETLDDDELNIHVRRTRFISLFGITSTNADLDGPNPTITGSYLITDQWQRVVQQVDTSLSLETVLGNDIIEEETEVGTFILNLNQITE